MALRGLKLFLQFTALTAALTSIYLFTPNGVSTAKQLHTRTPSEVTQLSTRTWAIWTALVAAIRLSAAGDLENGRLYFLAWFTLAIAVWFWTAEFLLYKTVSLEAAWFPMAIDGVAFLYMSYVGVRGS
ncbi:ergosterol biosynthesis protein [Cladophialophora chaetospira]|uniref:Ergosterol biosynthesis protein n=1 Tax=Cladophialophora chaetospira TaxID=386627 RepID=A0AA39CBP8_9EURO|nr:ergosterol biosynthesis protein [Cladophialophora chaetospira]